MNSKIENACTAKQRSQVLALVIGISTLLIGLAILVWSMDSFSQMISEGAMGLKRAGNAIAEFRLATAISALAAIMSYLFVSFLMLFVLIPLFFVLLKAGVDAIRGKSSGCFEFVLSMLDKRKA